MQERGGFAQAMQSLPAEALTEPGRAANPGPDFPAHESAHFRAGAARPRTDSGYPWPKLFTLCVLGAIGSMIQPAQWMRYYAARDRKSLARGAVITAVALPLCFLLGVMLVGLGGQILYPPDSASAVEPDRILIRVLNDELPLLLGAAVGGVLASVVVVAIMAASMSTADSSLHAMSAVVVRDVYDRYVRPKAGERERVWVGRLVIVAAAAISLFLVLRGHQYQLATGARYPVLREIAKLGIVAIGFCAQLLPLTIDMLYLRRGTKIGATVGLVAGIAITFVFGPLFAALADATGGAAGPLGGLAAAVGRMNQAVPIDPSAWGFLVNLGLFVLLSTLTRRPPAETRTAYERILASSDATSR